MYGMPLVSDQNRCCDLKSDKAYPKSCFIEITLPSPLQHNYNNKYCDCII